jgi:hypothetical protein
MGTATFGHITIELRCEECGHEWQDDSEEECAANALDMVSTDCPKGCDDEGTEEK